MKLSIVAAIAANRVIGVEGGLPWHLPADLRRFKTITLGKPILMGRRTHESIGRALPGRSNLVLTHQDPAHLAAGCIAVHSLPEACKAAGDAPELMIIGGAALYRETLPLAHRMYLTEVHAAVAGDVYFPHFDASQWREIERTEHSEDSDHACAFSFVILDRV